MFENIPIEKRWKVIMGIIGLGFVVSLLYARQVWDLQARVETLRAKTSLLEDADMEIVNRQVELQQLGTSIEGLQRPMQDLDRQGAMMQYIEARCDSLGLRLVDLPQQHIESRERYELAQVDFSVTGSYHSIVSLLYTIERVDRVGSVGRVALSLLRLQADAAEEALLVAEIGLVRLKQQHEATEHESIP